MKCNGYNISEVISKLLDEKNLETLTGVDAIPSFAMDAVVLLKEQNERIEKMRVHYLVKQMKKSES